MCTDPYSKFFLEEDRTFEIISVLIFLGILINTMGCFCLYSATSYPDAKTILTAWIKPVDEGSGASPFTDLEDLSTPGSLKSSSKRDPENSSMSESSSSSVDLAIV